MTNIVALLFVIVVSVVDRSDAVSCYNCQYVSIQPQGSTCVEPFNATSAPKCNGPACEFIFQNITEYYGVTRNCTSQITYQVDQCLMYNEQFKQYNYTFFIYGSSCCLSTNGFTQDGVAYETISCMCQKDDCNGDLPHKLPKTLNTGLSLKPVSKISIGIFAIFAVLSKISWYRFEYNDQIE